jgi:hypothetical protein
MNLIRTLFALTLLVRLIGEAPSVTGSIAPTLQPIPSRQTSYSYAQFFGQRWHLVVGYQGSEKIFDYNPEWTVKVIRERAILAFRLTQCQASLSLFNLAGVELPDKASTDAAGINAGDHLVLGPSKANPGTMIGCRMSLMRRAAPSRGRVIQEGPRCLVFVEGIDADSLALIAARESI